MADVSIDATPVAAAAPAPVAEHTYKFNVSMSCGGCSGAVDRVLKKLNGTFLRLIFHATNKYKTES